MFDIAPNERVALMGMTGSGKTYFARPVLSVARRLVVFDPKGLLSPRRRPDWNLTPYEQGIEKLERGKDARLWVRPPLDDAEYEPIFDRLLHIPNHVVYIDELYGVGPATGSRGLRALFTRGRELGIGVWAAFQRPRWIPLYSLSEAEVKIVFRLEMEQDRRYVADMIGPLALKPLQGHSFIFYRDGKAVYFPKGVKVIPPRIGPTPGAVV